MALQILGTALGRKEPLFRDVALTLPPEVESGQSGITLRDLLARLVRNEVAAFAQRQRDRGVLRVLTEREVRTAAQQGKVAFGETEVPATGVDPEAAIAVACQAFADGLYLVFLDDVAQQSLDAQVFPKPDSRLTIVRLVLLAGG